MSSKSMRIITKRHGKENPIEDMRILQRTLWTLQGNQLVPRGIYRFNSFEEADQWMIKTIVNIHALRQSRISSRSVKS